MSEGAVIQKKGSSLWKSQTNTIQCLESYRHLVGLLQWEIDLLKGLYLHRTKHKKNVRHPCYQWDSNPQFKFSGRRPYMLLAMWKQWSVITDQNKYLGNQYMGWYLSTLNPWTCFMLALSVKLCYPFQHKVCSHESPMPFRFIQHCAEKIIL
jgi:hypothetical protein